VQARRPYPQFGSIYRDSKSRKLDLSLAAAQGEKHLSHGLYFLSAFTWSKAINDLPEICCAFPFPQNSYDVAAEREWRTSIKSCAGSLVLIMSSHSRQPVRISTIVYSAQSPGRWHVGGIYTLASGFPFSAALGF